MANYSELYDMYSRALDDSRRVAKENYDRALQTAKENYETGSRVVNDTADSTINDQNLQTASNLRQSYIGNQQDLKNIGQKLSALGYSGGASESSLLGINSNYRNNRAGFETERTRANNKTNLQREADLAELLKNMRVANEGALGTYNLALKEAQDRYNQNYANTRAAELAEQAAAARAAAASRDYSAPTPAPAEQPQSKPYVSEDENIASSANYWRNIFNQMMETSDSREGTKQALYNRMRNYGLSAADANRIINSI